MVTSPRSCRTRRTDDGNRSGGLRREEGAGGKGTGRPITAGGMACIAGRLLWLWFACRRSALRAKVGQGDRGLGDGTVQTGEFIVGALGVGLTLIVALTASLVSRTRRRRQLGANESWAGSGRNEADAVRRRPGKGSEPASPGSDTPENWLSPLRSLQAGPAPRYARPQPDPDGRPAQPDVERRPPWPDLDRRPPQPDMERRPPWPDLDRRPAQPDMERRPPRADLDRRSPQPGMDRRSPQPGMDRRSPQPDMDRRPPRADLDRRPPQPDFDRRSPHPDAERRLSRPDLDRRPPQPDLDRRPPLPEPSRRTPRPEQDWRGARPEFNTGEQRPESAPRAPVPELNGRPLRTQPPRRQPPPDSAPRPPRPESNGRPPWPDLDRQQTRPEPNHGQLPPAMNDRQLPPAMNDRQLGIAMNDRQLPSEPDGRPSWPDLDRRPPRPELNHRQLPPAISDRQLPPEPHDRPSWPGSVPRPSRPESGPHPSGSEANGRQRRPGPMVRPYRLDPNGRQSRPEMNDHSSWSEPIPRPLLPEPIPRPSRPDPDLSLPRPELDRRLPREQSSRPLRPELSSRPPRPEFDRRAARPELDRGTSWSESSPTGPSHSSYAKRPAQPSMNEGQLPTVGHGPGYDAGPTVGYGPRPYAERGRRRDLRYGPGQETGHSAIHDRTRPPQDDDWQSDLGSGSSGPQDVWSSPVQDDRDHGGYADRRPFRPAPEHGPSARFAADRTSRATGPQPAHLRESLPPHATAPYEGATDPSYRAYSGPAGPQFAGAREAGTASDDTSPLPIVLDTRGAAEESFHSGQIWPPEQARASAERATSAPFARHERVPEPGPEPGGPTGSADHQLDLAVPGQNAAAQAKLDQLKDLYLTAEAIGEDALGKHFDELSQRQRSLISEYFSHRGLHPSGPSTAPGDARP